MYGTLGSNLALTDLLNVSGFLQKASLFVCFVCFVALPSKSTAMAMGGQSVHLTTLFPEA